MSEKNIKKDELEVLNVPDENSVDSVSNKKYLNIIDSPKKLK